MAQQSAGARDWEAADPSNENIEGQPTPPPPPHTHTRFGAENIANAA